ncbi:MAG TPA: hypothetical protein VMU29_10940 [Smithella sp.]|nr:hypothetical protein [Smithella sp.]
MKSLFSIVLVCLLLVPFKVFAVESDDINTDRPDCKIWNEVPAKKGESVTWSGQCEKGHASGYGEAVWSLNDKETQRFNGILKKGKCSGMGTLTFANGNKYSGDFKDNKMTGNGTYTFANGDKYEGSFVDSEFHGKGTLTFANGDKYEGDFAHDNFSGTGSYYYANGERYSGGFAYGNYNGKGTFVCSNYKEFKGKFENGYPIGFVIKCN